MREAAGERRRVRRAVRWLVFLVALGALYVGVLRRYRLRRLDVATVSAMAPALRPGAHHLIDRQPGFALAHDWIVWWVHDGGTLFSRVVGCPGDTIEQRQGRWIVRRAEGTQVMLRPEVRLPKAWDGAVLAPERYLLLNDRLDEEWADSRTVGPVARSAIRARVLFAFGGGGP